jgi:hypothetical protein
MNNSSPFSDRLQRAFNPADRGVIGLVDDLLELCRGQGLQLDWHANQCRVRPLGSGPREAIEIPLPKSVFRAVVARIAALCNERLPNSVSPYGGEGELAVDTNPPSIFHVAFTNTPGEQRLELRYDGDGRDEVNTTQELPDLELENEPLKSRDE